MVQESLSNRFCREAGCGAVTHKFPRNWDLVWTCMTRRTSSRKYGHSPGLLIPCTPSSILCGVTTPCSSCEFGRDIITHKMTPRPDHLPTPLALGTCRKNRCPSRVCHFLLCKPSPTYFLFSFTAPTPHPYPSTKRTCQPRRSGSALVFAGLPKMENKQKSRSGCQMCKQTRVGHPGTPPTPPRCFSPLPNSC